MIALIASTVIGVAIQDAQLPHHTFKETTEGWVLAGTMSPSAKVSLSHDPAHVKVGTGSLQFDYDIAQGETNILSLPITDGALTKMKSLDFWIQSDYTTTVAVILQEKEGGAYMARFMAPKGQWQMVRLAPSDFVLNSGPTDPKDPDGKLDLDQVTNISVVDLDFMFAQSDSPMTALFGVVKGAHAMYISDFRASEGMLDVPSAQTIESYDRPQVQWIGVGKPAMSIMTGPSLPGRALQVTYRTTAGMPVGALRSISPGSLSAATQISFKAVSQKPIKLLVQLEETNGNKYNTVVDVPGDSAGQPISVKFSDLKPSDDSKDKDAKLEAGLINQLVLADLSGMLTQTEQDNVLWIGKISSG